MDKHIRILVEPIAGLLLKSLFGDTTSKIGMGFLKANLDGVLAKDGRANALAAAKVIVGDVEEALIHDKFPGNDMAAAASALTETLTDHLTARFLIHNKLDSATINKALLDARPANSIFPANDPVIDAYERLIGELSPRLRALAKEFKEYGIERDAQILSTLETISKRPEKARKRLRSQLFARHHHPA